MADKATRFKPEINWWPDQRKYEARVWDAEKGAYWPADADRYWDGHVTDDSDTAYELAKRKAAALEEEHRAPCNPVEFLDLFEPCPKGEEETAIIRSDSMYGYFCIDEEEGLYSAFEPDKAEVLNYARRASGMYSKTLLRPKVKR